ncbi:hypothetical protein [Nitrososphaera sp.]|uniref:hypothetical protein n=1 Tax=Nitrososphaera sp. TaxID=1971748 RepID=UPI00183142C1|nr:hypothetical protein [Nitrososphaera sp.]NWG36012.1 hypothetical protein [Nitrososphaera sp.]
MASVSKDKTRKILARILKQRYADSYKKKIGKAVRNWDKLAESLILADIERAYSRDSALRTKQFRGLPKSTVMDRLASSPFHLFDKRKHGMHLKCERDGSAKFSPDEKDEAIARELKGLLEHMKASRKVLDLVLSFLGMSSQSTVDEVKSRFQSLSRPKKINLYGRIYQRIKKEGLLDPNYDYYYIHYESGSDRYWLSDFARILLKKASDEESKQSTLR